MAGSEQQALFVWRQAVFFNFFAYRKNRQEIRYANVFLFSVRMRREQDERRYDCHRSLLG
ncbi:hypothetical protein [Dickeya ananatis]